ncbi:N-6 DNA methylase [Alcaligenaceae bacterium]|nr:N-6 DNA methylase [Alcaligenaceae bacterium]
MATVLEPLTLTCPIRGLLKPRKKASADLSSLEERHRIDAIRHCLALGYDPKNIKIEAVVAKFGNSGKNSFRCDFAILDVDADSIDMHAPDAVDLLLQHARVLVEVKRDGSKADYVRKTQVEPLLKFAPRKDTIALYWDGVTPRVFWKEDDGSSFSIKSGPLALLPRPGKNIKAKPLTHADLLPPDSLLDIFSRIEDILHGASISLEERYEVMLQLILAKIYDEHESESHPTRPCAFQDYDSLGMSPKNAAKDLNNALTSAVSFYSAHLPKAIEDQFQLEPDVLTYCGQIMAPHLITAANKEVIQTFYMKFAKDLYRWDLAQYFTPPTVTDFIVEALNPTSGELVKDPACGSADFLVATFHRSRAKKIKNAADMMYGADDDTKAVQISVLNMLLNGDGKTNVKKEDSLSAVAIDQARATTDKKFKPFQYHLLVCNPPFGVKIVEKRREVLQQFDLGHTWEKNEKGQWTKSSRVLPQQEKGLLFAEVCVRQARSRGRIAIILPNGYMGNRSDRYVGFREWLLRQCRLVSVCGFPRFTFKTSGADVSASVLFLEKRAKPLSSSSDDSDYMFNAELIENVGWSVGDSKALPVYDRAEADGSYLVGSNGKKIVKSDFAAVLDDMRTSPAVSHFPWLVKDLDLPSHSTSKLGWALSIENVLNDKTLTFDPKRHSRKYAALVQDIESRPHFKLTELFEIISQGKSSTGTSFKKQDEEVYDYVDIDNMGAGEYRVTAYRGWQLPSRARHTVAPLDVFVGSIWSSVTKWCLIGRNPSTNTIVTNGCHRLRLKKGMGEKLLDAAVFFCSEAYATQMRALARGSDGLAEIHEDDLKHVLIPQIVDPAQRAQLQPFLNALLEGPGTLKGMVQDMLGNAQLDLPIPPNRPHHSALV